MATLCWQRSSDRGSNGANRSSVIVMLERVDRWLDVLDNEITFELVNNHGPIPGVFVF